MFETARIKDNSRPKTKIHVFPIIEGLIMTTKITLNTCTIHIEGPKEDWFYQLGYPR